MNKNICLENDDCYISKKNVRLYLPLIWFIKSQITAIVIVILLIYGTILFDGGDLYMSIKNTTMHNIYSLMDLSVRISYLIFMIMVFKYFYCDKSENVNKQKHK
ncbi:hypothetical protein J2746_002330 [Methanolobus bombayensis]|nr:hypothetical protein [Methanolobus bombayensis]